MKNEHGFTEVIDEPFLVHHSWYPEVKPYFPVKGKFMQGKKQRVFSISIYPTFCPFCGNEYE
jgi:hypothetical protein